MFLRLRDPPDDVFDSIPIIIFGVDVNSGKAKFVIKRSRDFFTDFRNKYNDGIVKYVQEYKRVRYISGLYVFFFTSLTMVLILIKLYL